jgi:peptide deformylase
MPIRPILHIGNPLLWEKSKPVDDPLSDDTKRIIADLEDTLADFRRQSGYGRAIAAPQIGEMKRIIFIRRDLADVETTGVSTYIPTGALINPAITKMSDELMEVWDDCLSIPNLMVRVLRSVRITLEYTDESGARLSVELDGDLSELIQHEYDHLEGILATQRAIDDKSFCTRQQWFKIHKA